MKKKTIEKRYDGRVAVIGIGQGAGATTISILLAKYLKNEGARVGYCQLDETGEYDAFYYFSMDRLEKINSFYYAVKQDKGIRRLCNMSEGINCAVRLPGESSVRLSEDEKLKLALGIGCECLVIDMGNFPDRKILDVADTIIVVVDPMPAKILQNLEMIKSFKRLAYEGYQIVWVINKMNGGVSLGEIKKSLKLEGVLEINFFDPKALYSSQFKAKNMLEIESIKEPIKRIIEELTN